MRVQRFAARLSHAALAQLLVCAACGAPVEKALGPAHARKPTPLATAGPIADEPKVGTGTLEKQAAPGAKGPADAGAPAATDGGGVESGSSPTAIARPAALPPTAEFVRIGERKLRCKRPRATKPTSRAEPGCRPATRAFGMFHGRESELEYGHYLTRGMETGRRHAELSLTDDASDCDVIRALCAVSGELVLFGAGGGIVLFPWVESADDLATAIERLEAQPGVSSVNYSYAIHDPGSRGSGYPE